jgi:Holliday junction resolvase RusA-like endonuclease
VIKSQFDLSLFNLNEDGSYSKKKTVLQPREMKSTSVNPCKPSKVDDNVIGVDVSHVYKMTGQMILPRIPDKHRTIKLTLFGEPMPKQSVRSFCTGKAGNGGRHILSHFQPKKMGERTADYVSQIKKQLPPDFKMFENRVHITKMHFIFAPLKAFHKVKGKMDAIRNGEIFYKETKPDLPDNLKKLVNDSMSGLVFKDDGIIVSEDDVKKYYGVGGCIIIELKGY